MNLAQKTYQLWSKFTYLGIKKDMPIELVVKIRLLNIIYLVVSSWSITIMITRLFTGNLEHLVILLGSFIFKTLCLLLNISGRHHLAWMLLILGYSTYLSWFWVFVDPEWDTCFMYFIVIFLIFIVFKGITQTLLVIYACAIYLIAPIIAPYIPEIYKDHITPFPYVTEYSFILYIILSGVIFTFYQSEIKRDRKKQGKTIDDLKNSNVNLTIAKNELEQFITIVSGELKQKTQVIQERVIHINKDLESQKIDEVATVLKITDTTAQQMYYLVNDILESSDMNQPISKVNTEGVNLSKLPNNDE